MLVSMLVSSRRSRRKFVITEDSEVKREDVVGKNEFKAKDT